MALVEIGARELPTTLVVRAENAEAVKRVAHERVALVDVRNALAECVPVIAAARLRVTGARVL